MQEQVNELLCHNNNGLVYFMGIKSVLLYKPYKTAVLKL